MNVAPLSIGLILSILALTGCERPASPPSEPPHTHTPGDGHDHAADKAAPKADGHEHADGHGHGAETKLGEQTIDGLTIVAVREGEAKAGGEGSFDCTIKSEAAKVAAVRMWVGTQDAKGSVKAKAALEGDGWHAHVEMPATLAPEMKLWVEVETDKGTRSLAGFGL